jgi:hypothetical protein
VSIDYEGKFDFAELRDRLNAAAPEATLAGGKIIMDLSDTKVPVLVDLKRANQKRRANPGELRDSRYLKNSGQDAEFGYLAYWARWQHERTDYHHEIGESKYLERAEVEGKDDALDEVARVLREAL